MDPTVLFEPDLLRRYDARGPRYTSYPSAARFSERVDEATYEQIATAARDRDAPLSLYVHIPFCRTVCF